jgi:hypothetical protein
VEIQPVYQVGVFIFYLQAADKIGTFVSDKGEPKKLLEKLLAPGHDFAGDASCKAALLELQVNISLNCTCNPTGVEKIVRKAKEVLKKVKGVLRKFEGGIWEYF